jgi:MscS family membrane protein
MDVSVSLWNVGKAAGVLVAAFILLKLLSIAFKYVTIFTKRTPTMWDDILFAILTRVAQFIVLAVAFSYVAGVLEHGTYTVLTIALMFIGAYYLLSIVDTVFLHIQENILKEPKMRLIDVLFPLLEKVSKVVTGLSALLVFLAYAGYDIIFVLGGIGLLGIVLSLAAKDIIYNAVAGIFLVLDKPFSLGDIIEVDSPSKEPVKGKVVAVQLRSTTLKTTDNTTVIIPNALLTRTIITCTERPQ